MGLNQGQLFGFPFNQSNADLIILPIMWEVTASFGCGSSQAYQGVLEVSSQLDFYHAVYHDCWKKGIYMPQPASFFLEEGEGYRKKARSVMTCLESGQDINVDDLEEVNQGCQRMVDLVRSMTLDNLSQGKTMGLLGGDHSVSLGLLQALDQCKMTFGILQIDAHMDLRKAYAGFTYSHASVMRHAVDLEQVQSLVQVGIRQCCDEEVNFASSNSNIYTFFDDEVKHLLYQGETWASICQRIIKPLPDLVYISFDIDGLAPSYCSHTGTPVMGGLSPDQCLFLFDCLIQSGRQIIGFDLVEVVPDSDSKLNQIIASQLLYQLSIRALFSRF